MMNKQVVAKYVAVTAFALNAQVLADIQLFTTNMQAWNTPSPGNPDERVITGRQNVNCCASLRVSATGLDNIVAGLTIFNNNDDDTNTGDQVILWVQSEAGDRVPIQEFRAIDYQFPNTTFLRIAELRIDGSLGQQSGIFDGQSIRASRIDNVSIGGDLLGAIVGRNRISTNPQSGTLTLQVDGDVISGGAHMFDGYIESVVIDGDVYQ